MAVFALVAVLFYAANIPVFVALIYESSKGAGVGFAVFSAKAARRSACKRRKKRAGKSKERAEKSKNRAEKSKNRAGKSKKRTGRKKTRTFPAFSTLLLFFRLLGRLLPKMQLKRFICAGTLGLSDAAATAVLCGSIRAASESLCAAAGICAEGELYPDFCRETVQLCLEGIFTVPLGHIILAVIQSAWAHFPAISRKKYCKMRKKLPFTGRKSSNPRKKSAFQGG